MFEVEKPRYEGPLLGAVAGGLMGYTSTTLIGVAGSALGGAALGAGLGAIGGKLMEGMMPGAQSMQRQEPSAPPPGAVPATPGAVGAPATPATPGSTPVASPIAPGEASPPTSQEIARGELERKRRGRVATILTKREDTVGGEENEKLGGPTGGI